MLNRNSTSKIKQSQADLVFAKFMDCSKRTISPRAAFISCQLTCPAATRPNRKPFMVAHEQECQMWKQSLSASTRFIFSIVLQVQFKCARRDPFTWPRLPRRDSSILHSWSNKFRMIRIRRLFLCRCIRFTRKLHNLNVSSMGRI